jgi:hypothetical protein
MRPTRCSNTSSTRSAYSRRDIFAIVRAIGRQLPDVEESTMYGAPALKVRGRMVACMASHKSAEPGTLVVMMPFEERNALIEEEPASYYLKEHYRNYPVVLVRLSRVQSDALRDLLTGALRFVTERRPRSKTARRSPYRSVR